VSLILQRRRNYTQEETDAIREYVEKSGMSTSGNALWRKMEKEKVTTSV
jgi:hypothetical protein